MRYEVVFRYDDLSPAQKKNFDRLLPISYVKADARHSLPVCDIGRGVSAIRGHSMNYILFKAPSARHVEDTLKRLDVSFPNEKASRDHVRSER